jgi:hypothetical protein
MAYFLLICHGLHGKRRVRHFPYCCVCIRYNVYVFTEPLPSNDRGYPCRHKLMERICEGRNGDGLRFLDVQKIPSFIKIGLANKKLIWGGGCTDERIA